MSALKIRLTPHDPEKKIILLIFISLMFVHVIFTFAGFYGNDDINYARYAAEIVHNGISFSPALDQYQLRWATVYSTAFFYWLFGINTFTSTLSSTISFALCGILLYKILRYKKNGIYFLSMVLFFFGRSIIFYSHRLLPDPTMCLAILWMYYSYRTYLLKKQQHLRHGIEFSAALFLAIITKATIIIALPLFLIFFLKDIFKRQNFQFWKIVILFSFVFLTAYSFYFKMTTGDFFYRYSVLVKKSYFNECSFDKLPFVFTLKRIGYELWRAMLFNGDFLVLIPGITSFIYRKKIELTDLEKTDIFSFLILLCCANFMSISASSYVPLCQDPRHFLFIFPFAAITGGHILYAFFKQPSKFIALPLIFALATAVIFSFGDGPKKYLYLLVTILLVGCYIFSFINDKRSLFTYSVIFFSALFFTNYLAGFIKPPYPYYEDQKEVIEKQFSRKNYHATIFSDDMSSELSEFFLKFEPGPFKFLPIDSVKSNNAGTLYYLLNGDLYPDIKNKMDSLMKKNKDKEVFVVYRKNNVYLYKVDNAVLQILKEN